MRDETPPLAEIGDASNGDRFSRPTFPRRTAPPPATNESWHITAVA